MKNSMVFYGSFYDVIKKLPHEDGYKLLMAIIEYGLLIKTEIDPLPFAADIAWTNIKPQLDANNNKYHNGLKGGAPVGNTNKKGKSTKNNLNQPSINQNQPNVNVNKNVNEKDIIEECNKKKSKPTLTEDEQSFIDGMTATYPHVMKLQQPLTLQQYQELCTEFSAERIKEVLVAMENYRQLTTKNRSAVLTIRNWMRRSNK